MKIQINRVKAAILFAILFVTLGWIAPAAYASYAPASTYMEVHEFSAQNTTTNSNVHMVCFDRTVHEAHTGQAFIELYLKNGDTDKTVEVDSSTMERYFQEGRHDVVTPFELPNHLQEGKYQYLLVVKMELVNGRVAREFAYTSDPFYVEDSSAEEQPDREAVC